MISYLKRIAILLILICSIGTSVAQPLNPNKKLTQYTIDHWGDELGLVSGGVLSILQSKEGYIWLGTFNGIYRFDGVDFRVYNKTNTPAITNNSILSVYEDKQGNIWAGTNGGGIVIISKDTIINYTSEDGLVSNSVNKFYEDNNSDIYICSKGGLSVFRDSTFFTYNQFYSEKDTLSNLSVQATYRDFEGVLWVGTNKGLYQLKGETLQRILLEQEEFGNFEIFSLVESEDEELFIGTYGDGVFVKKDTVFEKLDLPDIVDKVNFLYKDSNSSIWICHQNGVLRYHNGRFSNLTTEQGLSENEVEEVIEDNEGSIWITTYYGGVDRLRDGIFLNYSTTEGLTNNTIHAIHEDNNGVIWICTTDGVNKLNKDGSIEHLKKENGFLPGNLSRNVITDSKGNVWIATYDGLSRIRNGKAEFFTTKEGLSSNQVRVLFEDSKGDIWIGMRSGLNIYRNGKFEKISVNEGLKNDFILCIYENKKGEIWIGTSGGGIGVYKDGGIKHITTENGLPSDVVFKVFEDEDGVTWISTNNGLCRYDGKNFFYGFNSEQGLLNSALFQVIEDSVQNFWITCDLGILKVNKNELNDYAKGKTKIVNEISYKQIDGLKRSECTGAAFSAKSKDGKIWFATLGGVAVVNPSDKMVNTTPANVLVERLIVDQKELKLKQGELVRLASGTKNIEIKYTGLSLKVPQRVKFKYQLIGYDDDWVNPGSRRIAYYTNLAPGEYTFRVKASNNDGVWSEGVAQIIFYIEPSFRQTNLFYFLCALAVVIVFVVIYKLRTRSIKLERVKLKRLVTERTAEILSQKEEIESQRDNIENKNKLLHLNLEETEKKNLEIAIQKEQIEENSEKLLEAQHTIQEQNDRLTTSNEELEITVQNRTEELKNAYQEALVANEELDHFMYRSSHDLKGPISRLLGLCYLGKIEEGKVSNLEYLDKLELTAREMEHMISRLIRVSEIKSHEVEVTKIDIKALVNELASRNIPKVLQVSFEFLLQEKYVYSDIFLVNIVLENLIQNAVDFRDPEQEEHIINIASAISNGKLIIRVVNKGTPIVPGFETKIFDMFFKGTDQSKGVGLGLYVTKLIVVNKLDGVIRLNDANKEATEFIIELPLS